MVSIPQVNRDLAKITHMSMGRDGKIVIGEAELKLIAPLLIQNLDLVQRFDELSELSHVALEVNDVKWCHEICARMEQLEGGRKT